MIRPLTYIERNRWLPDLLQRIATAAMDSSRLSEPLRPITGNLRPSLVLTTAEYLQIIDWTGRQFAPGKRGRIASKSPAILAVIDRDAGRWAMRVGAFGNGWHRAAGSAQDLIALAERLGQRWMKGVRLALKLG